MRSRVWVAIALCLAAALLLWREDGDGSASARQRLILDQDFDGARLDRSVWSTCSLVAAKRLHDRDQRRARVRTCRGQVRPHRGSCDLIADRRASRGQGGRTYPYASGMISSGPPAGSHRPKFAFRYGRAEIRARVPSGNGTVVGVLAVAGQAGVQAGDRRDGDLRRPAPRSREMHLHYRDRDGREHAPGKEAADPRLRAGWHTFAVDWRPGKLVWLIDGVKRLAGHGQRRARTSRCT